MLLSLFESLESRNLFSAALAADLSADGVHPHDFIAYGSGVAFAGHSNAAGNELWFTAGTAKSTRPLLDFSSGDASSDATPVAAIGSTLLFTATAGKQSGLWSTGGSARTTHLIARGDVSAFGEFKNLGNAALFVVHDRAGRASVFRTDGTAAGTAAIATGLAARGGRIDLAVAGKAAFFFSGSSSRTPYRTDGTAAGTRAIAGYTGQPGQSLGGQFVAPLSTRATTGLYVIGAAGAPKLVQAFRTLTLVGTDAGNTAVYFHASAAKGAPAQAYRYDGRAVTRLTSFKNETLAAAVGRNTGGGLYEAIGGTLYGVSARGTSLNALAALPTDSKGRTGTIDRIVGSATGAVYVRRLVAGRGELLQLARGGFHSAGAIDPGATSLAAVAGRVYLARPDATGESELFTLTPTSTAPVQLTELAGGAASSGVCGTAAVDDAAIALTTRIVSQRAASQTYLTRSTLYALHVGQPATALWTSDTTVGADGLDQNAVYDAGGTAFFSVARTESDSASTTADLYRTDGTAAGTKLVMADVGLAVKFIGRAGAYAFFSRTNGTTLAVPLSGNGTGVVAISGRAISAAAVVVGAKLYVQSGGNTILEFNGATGTGRAINLTSHLPTGVTLGYLAAWNSKLVLILTDGGDERVSTLNTSTLAVTQIAQYTRFNSGAVTDVPLVDSATHTLWLADNYLWDGSRLSKIDLTSGAVAGPAPLFANSASTLLGNLNGKVIVASGGGGVYRSDGVHTPSLLAGTTDATATLLTPQGLYVETPGGVYLNDGTRLIAVAGKGASLARAARDANGRLYFTAFDAAHGVEMWSYLHQPGRIHGALFADTNGNGLQDTRENGLAGWRVFVDINGDGVCQRSEPSVFTAANGSYAFDDLADGRYLVTVAAPAGYTATTPAAYSVKLTPGGASTRYFGMQA